MGGNHMPKFKVVSEYQPSGDQPEAIAQLAAGLKAARHFVLSNR